MSCWFDKIYKFMYPNTNPSNISSKPTNRVGIFRLAFAPFILVIDNTKTALKIITLYSVILTLLALALGYSYMCAYSAEMKWLFCNNSNWMYWCYILLKIMVCGMFVGEWIKICFGEKYDIAKSFIVNRQKIKEISPTKPA